VKFADSAEATGRKIRMTTTASNARIEGDRRADLVPSHLVGGVGGLVFISTVIVQNAIRASAPGDGASAATVIHFYATSRTATFVLAALLPLGAAGLAAFVGTLCSRLWKHGSRASVLAGMLGAAGIFAMYSMLVATDLGLAGYVHRGGAEAGVVSALWVTHNTVFGVLLVAIAVALAGLSASAAAAGFVAGPWKQIGALGALALAVTGAATPALVDGSKIIALGLVGFLTWLTFVATCSVTLVRRRSPDG
jgi:hypothetical protein